MNKKKQAKEIIKILKKKYPKPECALEHKGPWQLLVATILSAQCTDKRVNIVTPSLFQRYPSVKSFAVADISELEKDIHSTGFFRSKSKNIIACAKNLLSLYKGNIPNTLSELIKLPGVGRKTASVVLGTAFGIAEGIVVDTHVIRLSNRLGLSENSDAVKIEKDLIEIVEKKYWITFSHLLILHGRERCNARKPDCINCEISNICPQNKL